jgi:hypothetical protein
MRTAVISAMVLVGTVCGFAFAAEPAGAEKLAQWQASVIEMQGHLFALTNASGDEYARVREKVLSTRDAASILEAAGKKSPDWHTRLLCDALALRATKPGSAALLHYPWNRFGNFQLPTAQVLAAGQRTPARPIESEPAYARLMIMAFGTEVFPLLAEDFLHSRTIKNSHGSFVTAACLSNAMVETRGARTVDVFAYTLTFLRRDDHVTERAAAAYGLEQCLVGRRDETWKPPGKEPEWFVVPLELKDLVKTRKLPALQTNVAQNKQILQVLGDSLSTDSDAQVRAQSAKALGLLGEDAVGVLVDAARDDGSAWVKAWCIASLRQIGGEQAAQGIKGVTSKLNTAVKADAELLAVSAGDFTPWSPLRGIPEGTILAPSSERKPTSPVMTRP